MQTHHWIAWENDNRKPVNYCQRQAAVESLDSLPSFFSSLFGWEGGGIAGHLISVKRGERFGWNRCCAKYRPIIWRERKERKSRCHGRIVRYTQCAKRAPGRKNIRAGDLLHTLSSFYNESVVRIEWQYFLFSSFFSPEEGRLRMVEISPHHERRVT